MEDINKSLAVSATDLGARTTGGVTADENTVSLTYNDGSKFKLSLRQNRPHAPWLRRLSPLYWIRQLLRHFFRDKDNDLFWTMDDDTYRLCMEYRASGKSIADKNR
jgi:hypothetical protein